MRDHAAVVQGRTVQMAIDAYLAARAADGVPLRTRETDGHRLRLLCHVGRNGAQDVSWLSAKGRGQKLYDDLSTRKHVRRDKHNKIIPTSAKSYSAATRNYSLKVGKAWCTWLVRHGWLATNPFADVETVGKITHGGTKAALSINEAKALLRACEKEPSLDVRAGVMIALLMGARASEIANLTVRDVDDHGRLLIVRGGKTHNAARVIEVPESLRPHLLALIESRDGTEPLLRKRNGKKVSRYWLNHHCGRVAAAARVSARPQTLRRTMARIAAGAGTAGHIVQQTLGQAIGTHVTERSYVGAGVMQSGKARSAAAKLAL